LSGFSIVAEKPDHSRAWIRRLIFERGHDNRRIETTGH
jgi:hypothetical protein